MLKNSPFLRYLAAIFESPAAASDTFRRSGYRTASGIFIQYHIPFLFLITFFSFFSLPRLLRADFSFSSGVFFPAALTVFLSILAAVFDRLAGAYKGPSVEDPEKPVPEHISLFLTFPVLSAAPLFFLHSAAGYAAVFLFAGVYTVYSVKLNADYYGFSIMRSWSLWIFAGIILLLPLTVFLILFNLLQAVQILRTY